MVGSGWRNMIVTLINYVKSAGRVARTMEVVNRNPRT